MSTSGQSPYRVSAGSICRERLVRDRPTLDPLCNFVAEIMEEVTLDNGVETSKVFVINGTLATGERLPTIRVPASRFAAMSWVPEQWGARAIVNAGPSIKDSLRAAIQRLSRRTIPRRVFTHCGWREVASGEWAFLTAAGSVGRDDIEVDLDPALSRYALPVKADDPVAAMKASLQLLKVAPLRVTVPLWAAVFRAPLAHAWPIDLSLWLEGMTGSLKSTLAALFLCHFGELRSPSPAGIVGIDREPTRVPRLHAQGHAVRHRRLRAARRA